MSVSAVSDLPCVHVSDSCDTASLVSFSMLEADLTAVILVAVTGKILAHSRPASKV